MSHLPAWLLALTLGLAPSLVGCQMGPQPSAIQLAMDITPQTLLEPQALDWTYHRIGGRQVALSREAFIERRVQAFPTSAWTTAGTPGVPLTSLGCAATDTVPNGPAASFVAPTSPLANRVFFLTEQGKFIKIDSTDSTNHATLNVGGTFSRTYVTLSPDSKRAYLLSNTGTLSIVDTTSMTVSATVNVPGGYGIAAVYDPFTSKANGSLDVLYVPANNGYVYRYMVSPSAGGVSVSAPQSYPVSASITPIGTETRKIMAPAIVLKGVIYQGDQGGNLQVYDTANPANNASFGFGAPVNTPPAIELQDGSYSLTDPAGDAKSVPRGTPIFAFVNAGATCAWANLHDLTNTYSMKLVIDDNDTARVRGSLLSYNYSTTGIVETLAAEDGGNINTEKPDRALPGYEPAIWANDYLVPAETNTYEEDGLARGGPVVSYIRWTGGTHPAGSIINSAQLTLTCAFDQACRVPEMRTASPYDKAGAVWLSNGLNNTNRPAVGTGNSGQYLSGGVDKKSGNVVFKKDKQYDWNVSKAFAAPDPSGRYALAIKYNAEGDAVLWPDGPVGGAVGKKAKKAYQVEAVKFYNNPLNADPTVVDKGKGGKGEHRPVLELVIAATVLPTPSIETAPVIDALNKRVYVFYTNALYSLDFASPAAWSDTIDGEEHTYFNLTYHGRKGNGGGATYNGKKKFVGNDSSPVFNYRLDAAFLIDRYPNPDGATPSKYDYGLNKINLPLNPNADRLAAGTRRFTGLTKTASQYMVIDPFSNVYTTGGNVYLGLGDGRIYQYEQ